MLRLSAIALRRILAVLLCSILGSSIVSADEPVATSPVAAAAARVRAAFASEDPEQMAATLADQPDPWHVVDYLCQRAHHAAALAFAERLAPKHAIYTGLPVYVRAQVDRAAEPEIDRQRVRLETALAEAKWSAALRVARAPIEPLDTVARIRLEAARFRALLANDRFDEAEASVTRVSAAARAIGWIALAARAPQGAGEFFLVMDVYDRAARQFAASVQEMQDLGVPGRSAAVLVRQARALRFAGQHAESRDVLDQAKAVLGADTKDAGLVAIWFERGLVERDAGRAAEARSALVRAVEFAGRFDDIAARADAAYELGLLQRAAGEWEAAQASLEQARRDHETVGDERGMGNAGLALGALSVQRGAAGDALRWGLDARDHFEADGDEVAAARARINVADALYHLARFEEARDHVRGAIEVFERRELGVDVAQASNALGVAEHALGRPAAALAAYQRAADFYEAAGDAGELALTKNNIAAIRQELGDWEQAAELYRESIALASTAGDEYHALQFSRNLANAELKLGRNEDAEARLTQVAKRAGELGAVHLRRSMLLVLGSVQSKRGAHEAAMQTYQTVLAGDGIEDDPFHHAVALGDLGLEYLRSGQKERAQATMAQALTIADQIRARWLQFVLNENLGRLLIPDWPAAVPHFRAAVEVAAGTRGGWDDETATRPREELYDVIRAGLLASQMAGDMDSMLFFFEHGRAHALVEALRADGWRGDELFSPTRRTRIRQLEAQVQAALRVYRDATQSPQRKPRREARSRWDELETALDQEILRAQREQRAAASVAMPRPPTVAEVQRHLRPGEAVVLYDLERLMAIAQVITPESARTAQLGLATRLVGLARTLLSADKQTIDDVAVKQLRLWLVGVLGLDDVERLYVCPSGPIAYVPFTLLAPDKEVVVLPSATVLTLLRERGRERGVGVLGVGNPDYPYVPDDVASAAGTRAADRTRLEPLPESGPEVEAVADVILLGRDATETRFHAAVATRPRWRAVHFACHGLIDPDDPRRSSLALTMDARTDGFLTVGEVMRSSINADLVVLSACDTARGTIYRTEGIVGPARAFMIAGAPRVIASLWKVDDAATRALMTKFYELWDPEPVEGAEAAGLGAAAALKAAQAHVRAQDGWEHPYYWAAWVLWGLS